jgi:ABC-type multidrug transport system fused ATPase/permease subunit
VLGTVVLVGWFNPWSFIPAAISGAGMLYIRYRYVQCSRDLKRIDSTTRSSVLSHLSSTAQGLKVIRSYHTENMCSKEFFTLLDSNTSAYYLLLTTNRWAAIRFDWIGIFFIALSTILAVIAHIIRHSFSAGDIALILSSTLGLMSRLQWTIRLNYLTV